MCRVVFSACTLVFLFVGTSSAQVGNGADFNVLLGIPQGAFGDRLDETAIGVTAFFGGPVPQSPLILGTEIGFLNYGSSDQLTIYRTKFDRGIEDQFAFPVQALSIEGSNNIILGHLVARIQAPTPVIKPYIDALAGVKYFWTRVDVESDVIVFRNGLSQNLDVKDWAFSYGIGGGVELQVYEQPTTWGDRTVAVSVHGGVRYLFGTEANYVREGSVRESDGQIQFGVQSSRTDMLLPHFGIRVTQ